MSADNGWKNEFLQPNFPRKALSLFSLRVDIARKYIFIPAINITSARTTVRTVTLASRDIKHCHPGLWCPRLYANITRVSFVVRDKWQEAQWHSLSGDFDSPTARVWRNRFKSVIVTLFERTGADTQTGGAWWLHSRYAPRFSVFVRKHGAR